MAEPGAPKSARQEPPVQGGSKLVSRIEPRSASQAPPAGARAIPTRNPKAPLPPRVSLADPAEVLSAPKVTIEPESVKTMAAPPRPASQPPRPPHPSISGREDAETHASLPKDFQQALAKLQRQRETGAPAPAPPPSRPSGLGASSSEVPIAPSTKSITSPFGALGLKPGTSPLSPSRVPAPMAIVGGGSLKVSSPAQPISPSRPPPSSLLAAIDANAPKVPTNDSVAPPPVPMAYPPAPSTVKGLPPVPPASPSSRPTTSPKSFAPAGGPPASYERAFRQWSSPNISTAHEASAASSEPVTFQVYTAKDISAGRAPMRSLPAIPPEAKKTTLAARIGMAAVGGVITLLTAAAVIAVSTDDPKRPAPSETVASPAVPTTTTSNVATPPPSTITIGDPVDPVDELPPTPLPSTPSPVVAAPKPKPKAPATASGTATAPANLKSMAPPPNPYAK